ncbi:MAG: diadenylate cyclase [Candidatus Omnitrophota bacterium]
MNFDALTPILFWLALLTGFGFILYHPADSCGNRLLRYGAGAFCLWTAVRWILTGILTVRFLDGVQMALVTFGFLLLSFQMLLGLWGRFRTWWRLRRKFGLPVYLAEITRALEAMAAKKMGALIVLERRSDLSPFLSKGFSFDGEVKSEILLSLFSHESPVHDGAILIRKGRIRALKVILPLASGPNVPLGVGTRHRSAIGITEKADALSLVASEERGEISVAFGGQLFRGLSKEDLDRLVYQAMRSKRIKPPARFLQTK